MKGCRQPALQAGEQRLEGRARCPEKSHSQKEPSQQHQKKSSKTTDSSEGWGKRHLRSLSLHGNPVMGNPPEMSSQSLQPIASLYSSLQGILMSVRSKFHSQCPEHEVFEDKNHIMASCSAATEGFHRNREHNRS